jgi:hypothetical protein
MGINRAARITPTDMEKCIHFTPTPDVAVLFCVSAGKLSIGEVPAGISMSGMPEGNIVVTFAEADGADVTVGSSETDGEAVEKSLILGSELCPAVVSMLG